MVLVVPGGVAAFAPRINSMNCTAVPVASAILDRLLGAVDVGDGISESSQVPSPIYRQNAYEIVAGASTVETPISSGEMELSLNIQVVYSILSD